MGGRTSSDAAARVTEISGWVTRRTNAGLQIEAEDERLVQYLEVVLDEVAAERRAAAVTLARVMAELKDEGWTQETAAAALRGEPWQTSSYCSTCYDRHPGSCACACHLPAATVTVPGEMAVAA
jgi:hypothetical protein